jgi:hypothetical protein
LNLVLSIKIDENCKYLGFKKIMTVQLICLLIENEKYYENNDMIDILLIFFEIFTKLIFYYKNNNILHNLYCKILSILDKKKNNDLFEYV